MGITLPLSVERFRELFVSRQDIYSVQSAGGAGYLKVNKPLGDQTIKDHMNGKQTVGLYQLKDNKVKWALIDIDINKEIWTKDNFRVEDWQEKIDEQAKMVQDIFASRGMKSYRENSGFKGEHVWVFFDAPIQASTVKNVLDSMFEHLHMVDDNMHIEIFPKQTHAADTGTGSLVKAPLGKHQRSGVFSFFKDEIAEEGSIELVSEKTMSKAVNEFDTIFGNCVALRNIKDEGIHSEHLGHEERLALAYIFGNLGNEGVDYITKEVFSKLSDYDEEKTKYNLGRMKDYKPVTCAKLQKKGLCPGPCANIGGDKSPIAFHYRQLRKDTGAESIKAISRLDNFKIEGHCYYEKRPNDPLPEQISTFTLNLFEQIHIDDGIEPRTILKGHVTNDEGDHDIKITVEDFSSNEKLSSKIYAVLGNAGTYLADITKIRHASNLFSHKNKTFIKKIFGYNEAHTKYYTPSIVISADEIRDNDELIISLEGEGQAELLDMQKITEKELEPLVQHIKDDLLQLADFETTHTSFAHAMLPIIEAFVDPGDKSKYGLFLRGQTGTGKSFLFRALQNFYGNFPEDVATWGSTPYQIQLLGYFFKDCLFLVDDFKMSNITNYQGVLNILQTYSDNTARGRLKSSGVEMQKTHPIKGTLAITGEDSISGEASNIARMITIEYAGAERDMIKGGKVKSQKNMYNGFTPYYIKHILNQDKDEISNTRQNYLEEFFKVIEGQPNDIRIARNVAILMTSYYYISHFMWTKEEAEANIKKLKKYLGSLLTVVIDEAQEQKSSTRFWTLLQEYISSGRLQIAPEAGTFDAAGTRGTIIGFVSGDKTFIMHKLAYGEIQRTLRQQGDLLRHTIPSIIKDLRIEGKVVDKKSESRRFNGKNVRVVQVIFDKPDLTKDE